MDLDALLLKTGLKNDPKEDIKHYTKQIGNYKLSFIIIGVVIFLNLVIILYVFLYAKPKNKFPFNYTRKYDPSTQG